MIWVAMQSHWFHCNAFAYSTIHSSSYQYSNLGCQKMISCSKQRPWLKYNDRVSQKPLCLITITISVPSHCMSNGLPCSNGARVNATLHVCPHRYDEWNAHEANAEETRVDQVFGTVKREYTAIPLCGRVGVCLEQYLSLVTNVHTPFKLCAPCLHTV